MGYKANDGVNEARFKLRQKRKTPLLDLMTEDELAWWLGCNNKTLYYYRRELEMPFIKLGRDIYYSETQIYRWLLSRQIQIVRNGEGEMELPMVYKSAPTRKKSKKQKSVSGKKKVDSGKTK